MSVYHTNRSAYDYYYNITYFSKNIIQLLIFNMKYVIIISSSTITQLLKADPCRPPPPTICRRVSSINLLPRDNSRFAAVTFAALRIYYPLHPRPLGRREGFPIIISYSHHNCRTVSTGSEAYFRSSFRRIA